jgi:hypothetical protein
LIPASFCFGVLSFAALRSDNGHIFLFSLYTLCRCSWFFEHPSMSFAVVCSFLLLRVLVSYFGKRRLWDQKYFKRADTCIDMNFTSSAISNERRFRRFRHHGCRLWCYDSAISCIKVLCSTLLGVRNRKKAGLVLKQDWDEAGWKEGGQNNGKKSTASYLTWVVFRDEMCMVVVVVYMD